MCECGKLFGLLEELQKLIKTHLGTLYIQMQIMFLTAVCCFSLLSIQVNGGHTGYCCSHSMYYCFLSAL